MQKIIHFQSKTNFFFQLIADQFWSYRFVYRGCSSDIAFDIASSYYFRASKVTEHVISRVSGGEFKTKWKKPNET